MPPPERLRRVTRTLKLADEHAVLLRAAGAIRRRLPGDDRYGDPLSTAGEAPPEVLAQRLTVLGDERPSALRELGLGALQVWQALSEAQGRGQGHEEVAILFTDLVDFSEWALDAGDTLALELLRRVGAETEPCVRAHGGRVIKRLGDGMMARFRSAEDAVEAALAAHHAAADVRVGGHRPRLRAGVHVGRPRELGGDLFGVDVNVAARLCAAAKADQVLVSEAVHERLGDDRGARRRWRFGAKGTPSGMKVYAIEATPAGA